MKKGELHINLVFEFFFYPGDWFTIRIVPNYRRRIGIKIFPIFIGVDYWRPLSAVGYPTGVIEGNFLNDVDMNRLVIEDWQQYGHEYIFFANLVDEIGEWIMLQVEGKRISAIGKKDTMKKFSALLDKNKIKYSFDVA